MGYVYTQGATKDDIVRKRTEDALIGIEGKTYRKCLAHTVVDHCNGDVILYAVFAIYDTITKEETDISKRWIEVDSLSYSGFNWGYKDMEESSEPYYYKCPVEYLDMVPTVTCQKWRDSVRQIAAS